MLAPAPREHKRLCPAGVSDATGPEQIYTFAPGADVNATLELTTGIAGLDVLVLEDRGAGCAPSDFWNYEYRNIPRPLWPWDEAISWTADPVLVAPASSPS